MPSPRRRSRPAPFVCLAVALVLAGPTVIAPPPAHAARKPPAVKTIRVKNAGSIHVVLGKTRESAASVRADKDGWMLLLGAELDGSTAELEDVTPNVRPTRWTLEVGEGRIRLDRERFLPTHVYRVVLRKERQMLGSVLVYLRQPPAGPRKSNLDFADEGKGQGEGESDPSAPIAPSKKGRL